MKHHCLTQPLLTEDGFLNPACIAEFKNAIKNIPTTHERLANDPEWAKKRWTFLREITGALACWAIRQINSCGEVDKTPFPPDLEQVIGYLDACIRPKFDKTGMAKLSLCDVSRMLHDVLMDEKIFTQWNDPKVLTNWLDLHALIHNVCLSIRDERRINDAFDRKFEEEYGE